MGTSWVKKRVLSSDKRVDAVDIYLEMDGPEKLVTRSIKKPPSVSRYQTCGESPWSSPLSPLQL